MTTNPELPSYLAYCRAGFEAELATELTALAKAKPHHLTAVAGSGFVHAVFNRGIKLADPSWQSAVFARQLIVADAKPVDLPMQDRVTPLMAAAQHLLTMRGMEKVSAIWVEYPDTNEGKALSKLAQALQIRLTEGLQRAGRLQQGIQTRLHVLLTPERQAWLGTSDVRQASTWPLGIVRLRMPHDAPSRSTLKLAEAFHTFLGDQATRLLMPEMRAVDLGAAPGGWTWQLINRGLHVTAVDNGRLKGDLVDNALVRHLREDGFRFKPKKAVDWMVCDMVESPARIATLVGNWLSQGWARHSIFNLKLPMKKRYEEVERCRGILMEAMAGKRYRLQLKQLYHDREEVTGYCGLIPRSKS
ncbi:MAG: 23S rRNA (cytidine(2498)-2'-O)-methyltransferase RlmM [Betaproteobacteria bacterium]|nr:23S rRNA (cytidine(2498)-2'-O)-methyltransferase RlmM [Betaproteobacteria bacterium]